MALQAWNPSQKNADITLSGSNLIATQGTTGSAESCYALNGVTTGLYYWEFIVVIQTSSASDFYGIGNTSSSTASGHNLGDTGGDSVGYSGLNLFFNGAGVASLADPGTGTHTLCFALDMTHKKFWPRLGTAGGWMNDVIGNQNPATNTGGYTLPAGVYAHAVVPGWTGFFASDACTGVFASASWTGTAPSGFGPFDAAAVPSIFSSPYIQLAPLIAQ